MTTPILSDEQQYVLQLFNEGQNILITGAGGSGKSTLIHLLYSTAIENNKKIQVCAMTGCASLLLNCNSKTIHSWSGIKLGKEKREIIISNIQKNKKLKTEWSKIDILIVDEISMMNLPIFELLDNIGKVLRKNNRPFGGIQLIFSADFYQLGPVSDNKEKASYCFESEHWYDTFKIENHVELKTIYRQKDSIYKDILNNIRIGKITKNQLLILKTRLNCKPKENECIPVKIFPTKKKVDQHNSFMFDKLDGEIHTFDQISLVNCTTKMNDYSPILIELLVPLTSYEQERELANLLAKTQCVPKLQLKIGTAVMCIINYKDSPIMNGSQGIVIKFVHNFPLVRFSNGQEKIIQLYYWQSTEFPSIAIGQVPLILAWAVTIHKTQGVTLDQAEIDLGNEIFEDGQIYVALSRVRTLDGLYLTAFNPDKIMVNNKVVNFYAALPTIEYTTEEEDTNEDDTNEDDTNEDDTNKEDTNEDDTNKEDTNKEDTNKEDTNKDVKIIYMNR